MNIALDSPCEVPKYTGYSVYTLYDKIWENNDKAISQAYLSTDESERHSGLGKAYQYFIKHYEGLTQFCKVVGAPIDNNIMEEGLKVKIRTRKTSHFYKTTVGADVANVLTSVITTTHRNSVNAYCYLNRIQRNKVSVADNPASWLPWGELGRDEAG